MILDYDKDSSFFAVYDGHGGNEVAEYLSRNLPDFLKDMETYKDGDIEKTLIDGFLKMDTSLNTPEVLSILKEIAMDDADTENIDTLYEEASMPVEKVIEKYIEGDVQSDPKSKGESSKSSDINNQAGCSKERPRPDRTRSSNFNRRPSDTEKVTDDTEGTCEKATEKSDDLADKVENVDSDKSNQVNDAEKSEKVDGLNDVEKSDENEGNLY